MTISRCVSQALTCLIFLQLPEHLTAADPAGPASTVAEDQETCHRHLEAIYKAIQAYREKNKDVPNWLSDLIPNFLQDTNLLICPVALRTGAGNPSRLTADPKFATSYSYQFCPVSMGSVWQGEEISMRTYQRKLMGQLGSDVPIVRCSLHDKVLNLSFGGRIFESSQNWEGNFAGVINPLALSPNRLAASEAAEFSGPPPSGAVALEGAAPWAKLLNSRIPARADAAKPGLIDLTGYYNAGLTETWHPPNDVSMGHRNDLSNLPRGLQKLSGVEFDVRGVIQLQGRTLQGWGAAFPEQVKGIKVKQAAKALHFLHGAGYQARDGTVIGYYIINYSSGPERRIPIVYGQDVRDWWYWETEPKTADHSRIA